MTETRISAPVELTDAELDFVAAGTHRLGHASLVEAVVVVRDNEIVKDVNVNANVLTGPSVIVNR
jgi:hypothetical protein